MNDNTMFIRMNKNKVEYAYELPENYDYEIIECDGDYKNILKKIGKIKEKIIKIVVSFGQVKYIFNLPKNYDYEIIESEE
jgi:hypothetical protein